MFIHRAESFLKISGYLYVPRYFNTNLADYEIFHHRILNLPSKINVRTLILELKTTQNNFMR